jgi:hypothetical protein
MRDDPINVVAWDRPITVGAWTFVATVFVPTFEGKYPWQVERVPRGAKAVRRERVASGASMSKAESKAAAWAALSAAVRAQHTGRLDDEGIRWGTP